MKTRLSLAAALLAAVLVISCNEPSSPSGSLPPVTNLAVDFDLSRGDTVVLTWDPVEVEGGVDGYHIWFSPIGVAWDEYVSADTTWSHEGATSAGSYYAKASKGLDYSSENSNEVHTTTNRVQGDYLLRVDGSDGFRFGQGCGLMGEASADSFPQDIYIAVADSSIYIYSGDHDPENYPGGSRTLLCRQGALGNVAPEPGAGNWVDSVRVDDWMNVFGQLSNGHFVRMRIDTVYTNGFDCYMYEYQTIPALRLFDAW